MRKRVGCASALLTSSSFLLRRSGQPSSRRSGSGQSIDISDCGCCYNKLVIVRTQLQKIADCNNTGLRRSIILQNRRLENRLTAARREREALNHETRDIRSLQQYIQATHAYAQPRFLVQTSHTPLKCKADCSSSAATQTRYAQIQRRRKRAIQRQIPTRKPQMSHEFASRQDPSLLLYIPITQIFPRKFQLD